MSCFNNFPNYNPNRFSRSKGANFQNITAVTRQNNFKDVLRTNINKFAIVYTNFKVNNVFKGLLKQVGNDYLLLEDSNKNKHYLIMFTHINFIVFEDTMDSIYENKKNNELENKNSARTQLNLSAQSAILLDGNNENILFESNAFQQLPIASLTKIMTAIVAIESGNLNSEVVISQEAASQPPSSCPLTAGDTLLLRDLLYCLILQSGNDAAWAIENT